jgi:hypothetical protein
MNLAALSGLALGIGALLFASSKETKPPGAAPPTPPTPPTPPPSTPPVSWPPVPPIGGVPGIPPVPGVPPIGGIPGVPPPTTPPGVPPPPTSLLSCEQAIAMLPPPLAIIVSEARRTASPGQLAEVARTLDEGAAKTTEPTIKNAMLVTAQCLREEVVKKTPGVPPSPIVPGAKYDDAKPPHPSNPKGGPPVLGCASNPEFQWVHVVKEGQGPAAIAAIYFGIGTVERWSELVSANPRDYYSNRDLHPTGTPGTSSHVFGSLRPGDGLRIPKTWNRWVDQDGNPRHGPVPFPECP